MRFSIKPRNLNCAFIIVMFVSVLLSGNGILRYGTLPAGALSPPHASALPNTTVFLSPPKAFGLEGQNVSVNVNITGVSDLFSFQIGFLFDPSTAECVKVEDGGFLSNNGLDTMLSMTGTINNTKGLVTPYGWTLVNTAKAKNGNGILTKFSFHMKTTGYSNIHLYSFIAMNTTELMQIPVRIIDVYTPVREWSECSINIVGNARGQSVNGEGGYSAHNITKNPFPQWKYGQFTFNVTGFPIDGDSFAFCNVSIPKALMWANVPNGWFMYLNDYFRSPNHMYENATHTSLYFEFSYNASNPITRVAIEAGIDLEHPYPNAELSVSMDKWWFARGEDALVKAKFTIDSVGVNNGTVLLKVAYPNMSLYATILNKTDSNGNATFRFPINQNMLFGNYTIHVLAGKLEVPSAYAVKFFWIWRAPLIDPYPGQCACYRYRQYDGYNNLIALGWYNTSYTTYVEPNLINCSTRFFAAGVFGNLSLNDWICVNTTTRWIPKGSSAQAGVNSFFYLWIQTNVTLGSKIAILNTTGTITGSQNVLLRMADGTVGFVDCWIVEYSQAGPLTITETSYFDKKTGLYISEKLFMPDYNTTAYVELAETNIPIAYGWGDIDHEGRVNSTDLALMQNAWQARMGDINYDLNVDFNRDDIIAIKDLALIGFNWQRRRQTLP